MSDSVGGGWVAISGESAVSGWRALQSPFPWLRQRGGRGTERAPKSRCCCATTETKLAGNFTFKRTNTSHGVSRPRCRTGEEDQESKAPLKEKLVRE